MTKTPALKIPKIDWDGVNARLKDALSPTTDPLGKVKYTGKVDEDAKAELNAVQAAFAARRKEEADRKKVATDSGFWFCVCFKDRESRDAFRREHGIDHLGDQYINGHAFDKILKNKPGHK